ncbi:conserved hypothetical protein [Rubrivivax sp. A210]|uniref:YceD family protein n=1 Tax=Rubrivivax sp. A210 TaxID=2772301 RepID=UPI00191880EE|nr:YceD family protein [Rubrivivax sp. A210]CAD5370677.1 conserved hypothetical protein [Rubrivivax sp. A210]
MRDRRDPTALDIAALCREGEALEGRLALTPLERLTGSLFGAVAPGAEAAWSAQASQEPVAGGEPERWLHLQARAEVRLQCQRCLEALQQPLEVDRRYRFVRDDKLAEQLDEEIEDDVLALPPRLDLLELIEDELILALPIVPRHEGECPRPLPQPAAVAEVAAPNPFAKLAELRRPAPAADSDDGAK